ncbi:hypothetical protein OF83DRAFT_1144705 [Amylostereum chailletii]|nr:hypothetical protein OF83DRAFT_1144705 [Amylostereum chailletii]
MHYAEWTQFICLYIWSLQPSPSVSSYTIHYLVTWHQTTPCAQQPRALDLSHSIALVTRGLHPHNLLDASLISSQEVHAACLHTFRITGKKDTKPSEHNGSGVRYCDSFGKDIPKIEPAQTQIPGQARVQETVLEHGRTRRAEASVLGPARCIRWVGAGASSGACHCSASVRLIWSRRKNDSLVIIR